MPKENVRCKEGAVLESADGATLSVTVLADWPSSLNKNIYGTTTANLYSFVVRFYAQNMSFS